MDGTGSVGHGVLVFADAVHELKATDMEVSYRIIECIIAQSLLKLHTISTFSTYEISLAYGLRSADRSRVVSCVCVYFPRSSLSSKRYCH